MEKTFKYYLYSPCGNNTALVENNNDISEKIKKKLNEEIMKKHPEIEQVGFVNLDKYELVMAGGEFCGNATRCAVHYYLQGKRGEIKIKVSEDVILQAGISEDERVWTQMPLCDSENFIKNIDEGIYIVALKGIQILVIDNKLSKEYLNSKKQFKEITIDILDKYKMKDKEAAGVVFLEDIDSYLKIHPIIWVKEINTLFYETACGSATIAAAIFKSFRNCTTQTWDIVQPSNKIITAKIIFSQRKIKDAIIMGNVETDNEVREIEIEI